MVQWLRLGTFTAVGPGSIPGEGTKIPQASRSSQKRRTFAIPEVGGTWNEVLPKIGEPGTIFPP